MKHTNVNIDLGSLDYGQALPRFFFELKEIMVAAGWVVKGSGDGSGRYALDGATAALDLGQQGSGGDFDCWMTDGTVGLDTPGGVWASGAWVLLEEPAGGGGRQYVFQLSSFPPTVGNYGGYGIVAYSRAGDFTGGTPDHNTAPTSATAQFLAGSSLNGTGGYIWYAVTDLYRAHVWADDTPVNGAFGFGGFATRSTNATRAFIGQLPLGPADHVAADGDPTAHFQFDTNSVSLKRWQLYGTGSAAWGSFSVDTGHSNYWRGGGPTTDARDAIDRIAKVPLYQGSAATEQLAGETEHMRWSASPRAYPDFCRDQDGACWVWTATGILMPWEDAAAPALPPTPE